MNIDLATLEIKLKDQLRQLDQKRKELERKLAMIEEIRRFAVEGAESGSTRIDVAPSKHYKGRTQKEAVLDVLKEYDRPIDAATVTAALREGGFSFRTDKPTNSVYALLNQLSKKGMLVKVKDARRTLFRAGEKVRKAK